jgi:hypothetical protein
MSTANVPLVCKTSRQRAFQHSRGAIVILDSQNDHVDFFLCNREFYLLVPERVKAIVLDCFCFQEYLGTQRIRSRVKDHFNERIYYIFALYQFAWDLESPNNLEVYCELLNYESSLMMKKERRLK